MSLQDWVGLVLQISVLLTMFAYGLRTSPRDALYLPRRPALLVRSLFSMFVMMPALAILSVKAFALPHVVAVALLALALSPVPPVLPDTAGKAGGRSEYALGLMIVAGVLAIVIVPVGTALMGRIFGARSVAAPADLVSVVLQTIVLPVAVGLATRALFPRAAARVARPAAQVANGLLALGVLAILVAVIPESLALIGNGTILVIVTFVVAGLALGHWLAGDSPGHRTVLALATAVRHPAIALAILKTNYPTEPRLGAAIVLYLVVSLACTLPYVQHRKHVFASSLTTRNVGTTKARQ